MEHMGPTQGQDKTKKYTMYIYIYMCAYEYYILAVDLLYWHKANIFTDLPGRK